MNVKRAYRANRAKITNLIKLLCCNGLLCIQLIYMCLHSIICLYLHSAICLYSYGIICLYLHDTICL